ncbi:MAG: UvrD-helicase domain-containing protein [Deltaproteobacteria bacterium]|nr:MAG: UvrD-helicase domain-containing protein [Deltaproteobacteria bacterium]
MNPEQLDAVHHLDGPLLILAGAGSGKTRVITQRIAYMIQECGILPRNILAVTFTNKAADEMKHRVSQTLGSRAYETFISTFHSLCVRILRSSLPDTQRNFVIYDDGDSTTLIKEVLEELKLDEKSFNPKAINGRIQSAKNEIITPAQFATNSSDYFESRVADIYALYEKKLAQNNALDFGDLIFKTVLLFRERPDILENYHSLWKYIMVDEYQDTNKAQYVLTRLLAEPRKNLCVVGDDDQCLSGDSKITMKDGKFVPIKNVKVGDEVLSCYGSGAFRPARVTKKFVKKYRGEGVLIELQSGRKIFSTPEHTHFAGYRLGLVPQTYFTYLMHKKGVGWRLGTSQVYTAGQKKPMVGFRQRLMQEHADSLWVVGIHSNENDARSEEYILSLQYQLPTLPFVPRKGGSQNGLVHDAAYLDRVFKSFDTDSHAKKLLIDRHLSLLHPHHRPRSRNANRRNVVVTLCGDRRSLTPMHRISIIGNDKEGYANLKKLGFSVRNAKKDSKSWRFESSYKSFSEIEKFLSLLRKVFDVEVFFMARFGKASKERFANSLPFLPAASVLPGMAMFDAQGDYDVVKSVKRLPLNENVYDLNIENTHNFIANGIVTHNSIYRWRGADIQNILNFEQDFPGCKVIRLEQNYRSSQTILKLANAVISKNKARKGKNLWTDNGHGDRAYIYYAQDERDEARFVVQEIQKINQTAHVKYSDMAIFYRTNAQSRVFEEELRRQRVPYTIFGGVKFYDRKEIKDIISYLRVIVNPKDSLNLKRIINVPARGLGDKAVSHLEYFSSEHEAPLYEALTHIDDLPSVTAMARNKLRDFYQKMEGFKNFLNDNPHQVAALLKKVMEDSGYFEMLQKERTTESESRLENLYEFLTVAEEFEKSNEAPTLALFLDQLALVGQTDTYDPEKGVLPMMTLHLAKGLEFPYVFLVGMEEGLFPHARSLDVWEEMEEERRICYVGITRARERLYMSLAQRRHLYGGDQFNPPSRFLEEMPSDLVEKHESRQQPFSAGRSFGRRGMAFDDVADFSPSYDFDQRNPEDQGSLYRIGAQVSHPAFGKGVIKRSEGKGEHEKVTVYFNNGQVKTLMVKFANLAVE